MSDSLKEQLLGLGFKPAPKPERKAERKPERTTVPQRERRPAAPTHKGTHAGKGRPATKKSPARSEMDLGKAFAMRAQHEKQERIEAERQKQEQARLRREAKARLAELLKNQALNDPGADIARHFDYGGKIKRIHVTAAQLKALNGGELGVVQLDGRYLLVAASLLAEAEAIFAPAIALKVDPSAPAADDPYANPAYQVPDDLVW